MVGIHGIGGVPDPKPERAAPQRDRQGSAPAKNGEAQDAVVISSEAQAAARLTELVQAAAEQAEVRAEKVAAAKAAIERGDYQKPEIVRTVAERLDKYL